MDYHQVRLDRAGSQPLAFDGALLGRASSWAEGKDRWFEMTLYRASSGRWVVHGLGRSTVDGEDDRSWATVCASPEDVIAAMSRVDEDGVVYLTRTAQQVVSQAATVDDEIASAWVVTI